MKKVKLSLAFLALAAVMLWPAAGLAADAASKFIGGVPSAEAGGKMQGGAPAESPIKGLYKVTLKSDYQAKSAGPDQTNAVMALEYVYLAGSGNVAVDAALKKKALAEASAAMKEIALADLLAFGPSYAGYNKTKSFAFKPSADYLSVLVHNAYDGGGAHPNWSFEAMSFNLKTGKALTLRDVFPDPAKSLPLYWEYVRQKWQAAHQNFLTCEEDAQVFIKARIKSKDIKLDRLVFSPQGATLLLAAGESCGGYAAGNKLIDLPKEDLIQMGAAPELWQQ